MSDMLIRNMPDDLKRGIAMRAKRYGRSLSEEATRLLASAIKSEEPRKNAAEMMMAAFGPGDAAADGFAEIMAEIEAERKKDFGRGRRGRS